MKHQNQIRYPRFQAGYCKRRLNLAFVFCVYCVLYYISFDW